MTARTPYFNGARWSSTAGFGFFDPLVVQIDTTAGTGLDFSMQYWGGALAVDWGDGGTREFSNSAVSASVSHTYASPGIYEVSVYSRGGGPEMFTFKTDAGTQDKITALLNWGANLRMTYTTYLFEDCVNLTSVPATLPDTDLVTVTDLTGLFAGCTSFNDQNVTLWDMSNVEYTPSMFAGASSFAASVGSWGASAGFIDTSSMFNGCTSFDEDISTWDTSGMIFSNDMLKGCTSFNQSLSAWDTSALVEADGMFEGCTSFNSGVAWDVSSLQYARRMFKDATVFNQDISAWDMSSVYDMESMFENADAFNIDISGWTTTNVTCVDKMFKNAASFNQDLNDWCMTNVTSTPTEFRENASSYIAKIPLWGRCHDPYTEQDGLALDLQNDFTDSFTADATYEVATGATFDANGMSATAGTASLVSQMDTNTDGPIYGPTTILAVVDMDTTGSFDIGLTNEFDARTMMMTGASTGLAFECSGPSGASATTFTINQSVTPNDRVTVALAYDGIITWGYIYDHSTDTGYYKRRVGAFPNAMAQFDTMNVDISGATTDYVLTAEVRDAFMTESEVREFAGGWGFGGSAGASAAASAVHQPELVETWDGVEDDPWDSTTWPYQASEEPDPLNWDISIAEVSGEPMGRQVPYNGTVIARSEVDWYDLDFKFKQTTLTEDVYMYPKVFFRNEDPNAASATSARVTYAVEFQVVEPRITIMSIDADGNNTWMEWAEEFDMNVINQAHWIRLQIIDKDIKMKIWADGDPEPEHWRLRTVKDQLHQHGTFGFAATGTFAPDYVETPFIVDDLEVYVL